MFPLRYSDHELIAACGDLTGVTDDTFLMLLDIDLMDYKRLPIHNFPKNVKINPHGMYIYEKKESDCSMMFHVIV